MAASKQEIINECKCVDDGNPPLIHGCSLVTRNMPTTQALTFSCWIFHAGYLLTELCYSMHFTSSSTVRTIAAKATDGLVSFETLTCFRCYL